MNLSINQLRKKANESLAKHNEAKAMVRSEKRALTEIREKAQVAVESQAVIQTVASTVQSEAHRQLTTVVTHSLRTVFGPGIEFKINFPQKRGKTEARLCYVRNGIEVDPVSADGGGILDIAALALRISCLTLATPRRRKLLVLDEPLRNVHGDEYRERSAELVEALAKDLGIQIIMVTGMDWLKIGKVIEV